MSLNFADNFWGPGGFDVVEKRLNQGSESTKLFAYFLEERAAIEDRYAQSLQKLLKSTSQLTEFGTLRDAWLAIRGEMENLAKVHRDLGASLLRDIAQPMLKFKEDQSKLRKQYLSEAYKINKERKELELKLVKSQERYEDTAKKADENEKIASKARAENRNQSDIVKLVAKAQKYAKDEMMCEHEYKESINKMKMFQPTWEEKTANTLKQLQVQEEERIEFIKTQLDKYIKADEINAPFVGESCKRLYEKIRAIDKIEDIECFVRENQTGSEKPVVPTFVPKSGAKIEGSGSNTFSVSNNSYNGAGSSGGSGFFNNKEKDNSSSGNKSSAPAARKAQPIMKVKALFDYVGADANEIDFFADDLIDVIETDSSGWWTGQIDGRTGLFPSNYVEEI